MGQPSIISYDVSLPDFERGKSSHFVEHCAGFMPGGGYALPGLLQIVGPVSAAPPGDV
ncbi:hypothetical protein AWI26_07265 [Enterobacter kobei]|nr:hypothetical protein A4308_11160 [Enterobacter sp. ODB01]KUQ71028.1 hypothetical protein AWI26_07265 [Enterobacter kobei]